MKSSLALLLAAFFALPALHAADPAPPLPELEAKFIATFANATMAGKYSPLKDGVLGPERDDKYSIVAAEKVTGSSWVIKAKFRGFVVPVPVEVKWAGDTAVIIVDALQLKAYGGGTYSARVMVHEHTYAGNWTGGDHGGLMSGLITNEGPKP